MCTNMPNKLFLTLFVDTRNSAAEACKFVSKHVKTYRVSKMLRNAACHTNAAFL